MIFSVFAGLYTITVNLILEHLQHSKRNHISSNILIPNSSITWKLLISNPIHDGKIVNLPLLDILCKWIHVKEWSFVISFFNLI